MAALDLGSTKVACLIAKISAEGVPQIIGAGHQASKGLKAGAIIDMDEVAAVVRSTVEAAEEMAEETVHGIIVNVSGGAPRSRLIAYDVAIGGHEISDADLKRILDPSELMKGEDEDRAILHAMPIGYSLDETRGIRDPRGMHGDRLGVNMHVVSASVSSLRNISTCVGLAHLDAQAMVVSPLASSLACLVDDEKELGVTLIDMGGGSTSIAVYFDGVLVHVDNIPVGGCHVTSDIAQGLSTPLSYAERLKTLYGSAVPSPSDDREVIRVPIIGDEEGLESNQVPRSMLVGIIRPRLEETFELVRERLEIAGFDKVAGRRVVLTGGASQVPGIRDIAAGILDKQVRLARPRQLLGLPEATSGPAFASVVGLLSYATQDRRDLPIMGLRENGSPSGRLSRLGQWIRDNF